MTEVTLLAPAKINLYLRILGRRADGFHALETRMVRIGIYDELRLRLLEQGSPAQLICSDPALLCDESNLAMRALRGFEQRVGHAVPVQIRLHKSIPFGAGLGGGSSDAAAVLRGLNQLYAEPLSLAELLEVGSALGSDVPFFLYDAVCDASGRGEVVVPVSWPYQLTLVMVKPPFGISTPWAYQHWSTSQELPEVRYTAQDCPWGQMVNDLERPAFQKHFLLPSLKMWLLEQPETVAALMSGSGSTMFAVVKEGANADALALRVREYVGEPSWVKITYTL